MNLQIGNGRPLDVITTTGRHFRWGGQIVARKCETLLWSRLMRD